jgi:hypothetical protein
MYRDVPSIDMILIPVEIVYPLTFVCSRRAPPLPPLPLPLPSPSPPPLARAPELFAAPELSSSVIIGFLSLFVLFVCLFVLFLFSPSVGPCSGMLGNILI